MLRNYTDCHRAWQKEKERENEEDYCKKKENVKENISRRKNGEEKKSEEKLKRRKMDVMKLDLNGLIFSGKGR